LIRQIYDQFEKVELILGQKDDIINIVDTVEGVETTINGGNGSDYFYLSNPIHSLLHVDGGDGPDTIILYLYLNCVITYYIV
jgi:hypothetical protein